MLPKKEFQFKLFIQHSILNHIIKYDFYTENRFIAHRCAKIKTSAHEKSSIPQYFIYFAHIKQPTNCFLKNSGQKFSAPNIYGLKRNVVITESCITSICTQYIGCRHMPSDLK